MPRRAALPCTVVIHIETEDSPDLSWLGEYSKTPEEVSIDRQERGDMRHGEFRYFNAGSGDPEYIEEDYKRMEAYNAGEWHMTGIWAEARIEVPVGDGATITQRVRTAGIWGVESDADESYLEEIYDEQLSELKSILKEMGVKCPVPRASEVQVAER